MNQISLYSGSGTVQSQRVIAQRMGAELQVVQARAEIANSRSQAAAGLSAAAINNLGTLASLGEQVVKSSPATGPYVGLILQSYAAGAAMQVNAFMR